MWKLVLKAGVVGGVVSLGAQQLLYVVMVRKARKCSDNLHIQLGGIFEMALAAGYTMTPEQEEVADLIRISINRNLGWGPSLNPINEMMTMLRESVAQSLSEMAQ